MKRYHSKTNFGSGKGFGKIHHNSTTDKRESSVETGSGHTRLDQEVLLVGVDYIRVTAKISTWDGVRALIEFLVNDSEYLIREEIPFSLGKGSPIYPSSIKTAVGINGGYRVVGDGGDNNYYEVIFDFSGQYLEKLSCLEQWRLCRGLWHQWQVRCTRLDIKIDDFSYRLIPLEKMLEAWKRGDVALIKQVRESNTQWHDKEGNLHKDSTYYFGSRNSRKMIRIYNHFHGEDEDGNKCYSRRLEAEFKRGSPDEIFQLIVSYDRGDFDNYESEDKVNEFLGQVLASHAVGCVDFVNKSEKSGERVNYKDCSRLSFWQEFIDGIGGWIRVSPVVKNVSLKDRVEWIRRQVAKSIKIVKDGLGVIGFQGFISNLCDEAEKRFNNEDWQLLEQLKKEVKKGYAV